MSRFGDADEASLYGSDVSSRSSPEARLQLARKKSEQLQRRRRLDIEQSRIQYEREQMQLDDEAEIAELEVQLGNVQPLKLISLNSSVESRGQQHAGVSQHPAVISHPVSHDQWHDQSTPQVMGKHPAPGCTATPPPLHFGLSDNVANGANNIPSVEYQSTPYVNGNMQADTVTGGDYNAGISVVNPTQDTLYNYPPPVNYVQNMELYNPSNVQPLQQYLTPTYPVSEPLVNSVNIQLPPPGYAHRSLPAVTQPTSDQLCDHHLAGRSPLPVPTSQSSPRAVQTNQQIDQQSMTSMLQLFANSLSLPRPELIKFSGKPMDYIRFINNFETNVSNRLIKPEDKLQYLIQNCDEDVQTTIKEFTVMELNAGYREARKELEELYGRPHVIAQSYVQSIVDGDIIDENDSRALSVLGNTMKRCMCTLNTLGYVADLNNTNNLLKITRRLPKHIRGKWAAYANRILEHNREPTFEDLTTFITARGRETNNIYGQDMNTFAPARYPKSNKTRKPERKRERAVTMATGVAVNKSTTTPTRTCKYCDGEHSLWTCTKLKSASFDDRRQFTRDKHLCDNCLIYGHLSGRCRKPSFCRLSNCDIRYKHHELLHPPRKNTDAVATNCHANVQQARKVFLRAVPVTIRSNAGKSVDVYALLDECSTTTLCSKKLARILGATGTTKQLTLATVNNTQHVNAMDIELHAHELDAPGNSVRLDHVLCVDDLPIKTEIPLRSDLNDYNHLDMIIPELQSKEIMLLIGSDYPEAFMETAPRKVGQLNELYAMRTKLGWSIVGPTRGPVNANVSVHFIKNELTPDEIVQHDMQKLWDTDFGDIHSEKTAMSINDRAAVDILRNSMSMDDGHYVTSLPWKEDPPQLQNNRTMAESRLKSLQKRLDRDKDLKSSYCDIMNSYEAKGYIRKVPTVVRPDNPTWYLPHHPVLHPKKKKIRIVYDAAAKHRGSCLNDHLYQGPDITSSLLGVLLRFRNHRVALAADIKEMFLQVKVTEPDTDALRFLWWENGDTTNQPADYQLLRHAFGLTSSPFVCNYVLQHAAEQCSDLYHESTVNTLKRNFYVDDCLKSVQSVDEAKMLIAELSNLLAASGFTLHKWLCNIPEVMDNIAEEDKTPSAAKFTFNSTNGEYSERTLGITWMVASDTFTFPSVVNDKPYTKRGILSMTSSFYDPIGFFCPVILTAKLILQDVTKSDVSWDDPVGSDARERWLKWLCTLRNISDVKISRCYVPAEFGTVVRKELHYFCDASSYGYGAVAYMRSTDDSGRVHVSFIMGKARLAPIKPITIPRLELSAATLASRMHITILEELRDDHKFNDIVFWTDSTTVLYYIRNRDARYKLFVANRVAVIHEHTTVSQWRYVKTDANPADHASRGLYGDNCIALKLWLHGPPYLQAAENDWPTQPDNLPLLYDAEVIKVNTHALVQEPVHNETILERILAHFSSWSKIKRSIAWLIKFQNWCKKEYLHRDVNVKAEMTVLELQAAELYAVELVQQTVFKAEYTALRNAKPILQSSPLLSLSPIMQDGLLRVGGRIQRAPISYDAKHQLLLPNKHSITVSIIRHYHLANGHVGVEDTLAYTREKYWIINAKSAVKRVISRCLICRRYNAPVQQQIMAPLPVERLEPCKPPFNYVGVDYFGPVYVKQRRSRVKRWVCLFTCLSIRAVHLEVAHSLDTDSYLLCLQRFINRRGRPEKLFSDNATNFTAADKELKQCLAELDQSKITRTLSEHHIEWSFNPPAASHMGGVWERVIRSARSIMKKILLEQIVDDEVLMTVTTECERILNDRPLVKSSSDHKDDSALTPSSLLLLRPNSSLPGGNFENQDYTRRRWRQSQYLSNVFWRRWIRHYLPTLQSRQKWNTVRENVKVNDLVLIADERVPRGQWPLARVIATRPDRQGHVRSVEVRSGGSVKCRPISKIVLLEHCDI